MYIRDPDLTTSPTSTNETIAQVEPAQYGVVALVQVPKVNEPVPEPAVTLATTVSRWFEAVTSIVYALPLVRPRRLITPPSLVRAGREISQFDAVLEATDVASVSTVLDVTAATV